jgi:hypothetical protein
VGAILTGDAASGAKAAARAVTGGVVMAGGRTGEGADAAEPAAEAAAEADAATGTAFAAGSTTEAAAGFSIAESSAMLSRWSGSRSRDWRAIWRNGSGRVDGIAGSASSS